MVFPRALSWVLFIIYTSDLISLLASDSVQSLFRARYYQLRQLCTYSYRYCYSYPFFHYHKTRLLLLSLCWLPGCPTELCGSRPMPCYLPYLPHTKFDHIFSYELDIPHCPFMQWIKECCLRQALHASPCSCIIHWALKPHSWCSCSNYSVEQGLLCSSCSLLCQAGYAFSTLDPKSGMPLGTLLTSKDCFARATSCFVFFNSSHHPLLSLSVHYYPASHSSLINTNQIYNARKVTSQCESEARIVSHQLTIQLTFQFLEGQEEIDWHCILFMLLSNKYLEYLQLISYCSSCFQSVDLSQILPSFTDHRYTIWQITKVCMSYARIPSKFPVYKRILSKFPV